MNKKKTLLLTIFGIIGLVLLTLGATFAFFNYTKEGTKDNSLTTDAITFIYEEVEAQGAGISLVDAFPISDGNGKIQSGSGKVFNFEIRSTTSKTKAIPYTVTARKSADSDLPEDAVRMYLTEVSGTTEKEVLLDTYGELPEAEVDVLPEGAVERIIYDGKVPANSPNYQKNFRLRMWVKEGTDFSGVKQEDGTIVYPYNDKKFSITVNVYANGKIVTEEELAYDNNANINSLSVGNNELTSVENQEYDYVTSLEEGTTEATINIETVNPDATVKIERIDSLAYNNSNIQRMAAQNKVSLNGGQNYFKVTVTSADKENEEEYILKIYVAAIMDSSYSLNVGQLVTAVDGSKWRVLEKSNSGSNNVVLLSELNLDENGNLSENDEEFVFDEDGTSTYDETDTNNIGYFVANTYAPKVQASLPGTTNVTIPTFQQIADVDGLYHTSKDYPYEEEDGSISPQQLSFYKYSIHSSWLFNRHAADMNYFLKTPLVLDDGSSFSMGVKRNDNCYLQYEEGQEVTDSYCSFAPSDLVGSGVIRPVITTPKSNLHIPETTSYVNYNIGDSVTAKDGSKWHVLENSGIDQNTVVLLSDYVLNLNNGSYYTEQCYQDEVCSMMFDEDGSYTYDENDTNNIGYFVANTYAPKVTASLPGTTNVTIPTSDQLRSADIIFHFPGGDADIYESWLLSSSYWVKPGKFDSSDYIFAMEFYDGNNYGSLRTSWPEQNLSIRPVITTLKSNISK